MGDTLMHMTHKDAKLELDPFLVKSDTTSPDRHPGEHRGCTLLEMKVLTLTIFLVEPCLKIPLGTFSESPT